VCTTSGNSSSSVPYLAVLCKTIDMVLENVVQSPKVSEIELNDRKIIRNGFMA